jgi:hypothetical protein
MILADLSTTHLRALNGLIAAISCSFEAPIP